MRQIVLYNNASYSSPYKNKKTEIDYKYKVVSDVTNNNNMIIISINSSNINVN